MITSSKIKEYNKNGVVVLRNIISRKSLDLFAEKNGARLVSCEDFSIGIDLHKQKDVMRSWTENNLSGNKDLFNALHIRQPYKIVVIEKLPQI